MTHGQLSAAFRQLDGILTDTQPLWRPQPFTGIDLPWQHTHPALTKALLALDEESAGALHYQPEQRLAWFRQLEPTLCDALTAFQPVASQTITPVTPGSFDAVGIPGRKWEQILAFAGALPKNDTPLVDWCAGKGHLSRVVQGSQQQAVHCLEWDGALVTAGKALAIRHGHSIHYHHHDVMQPLPSACSGAKMVHIGLHACGELHISLLQQAVAQDAQAVFLSPCCYHKISHEHYQPLSATAAQSPLRLNRQTLHLAVQDTVTAGRGERNMREQERQWRLGFDALQRELRGCDEYLSVPSSKRSLLRQGFPAFCQWAANTKKLQLPATIDYTHYLQRGHDKHRKIFRLELLRRLFNRPLELWLVLDRALYLSEQGYQVNISQFCDSQTTPRNLLLLAVKP